MCHRVSHVNYWPVNSLLFIFQRKEIGIKPTASRNYLREFNHTYIYNLKLFLNLNIFDHILPLPQVLPDLLPFPTPPTLSSFSKKQNPNTATKPRKQYYTPLSKKAKPNKSIHTPEKKNKTKTKKPVESVICQLLLNTRTVLEWLI